MIGYVCIICERPTDTVKRGVSGGSKRNKCFLIRTPALIIGRRISIKIAANRAKTL
jgi:hypothetical protein